MKVTISTPMKGQEIVSLLTGHEGDGCKFDFVGKKGMDHVFQVEGAVADEAAALAKKLIQGTEFGKVLYFSVKTE